MLAKYPTPELKTDGIDVMAEINVLFRENSCFAGLLGDMDEPVPPSGMPPPIISSCKLNSLQTRQKRSRFL